MIAVYLAGHWAGLWAWLCGLSLGGKVLVISLALTVAGLINLTREFMIAPLITVEPGTTQAIQDTGDEFTDNQWAELVNGFAADAYAYRGGSGLPGEQTRATTTDFDQAAGQACHLTETEDQT